MAFKHQKRTLAYDIILKIDDFKANIDIKSLTPVQPSNDYYQKSNGAVFSTVLVYLDGEEIKRLVILYLSDILDKTCNFALLCNQHLFKRDLFRNLLANRRRPTTNQEMDVDMESIYSTQQMDYITIDNQNIIPASSSSYPEIFSKFGIKRIIQWVDNGPTFKCYEYIFKLHQFAQQINFTIIIEFFTPYHSKADCDQVFSLLSRTLKYFKQSKEAKEEENRTSEKIVEYINNQHSKALESEKKHHENQEIKFNQKVADRMANGKPV